MDCVMPGQSFEERLASLTYAPGIHVFGAPSEHKAWMAGTSPAMTIKSDLS
jgi:hypothetical protein